MSGIKQQTGRLAGALLVLVLLVGLLPTAVVAKGPDTFRDVSSDAWYYNDVEKAVASGLINGYPDGTYGPDRNMTYAEAIKLAAVMYSLSTTGSTEFMASEPWYQTYVDYAKDVGIVSRDYDWDQPATRAGYMEIFANAIPDMPALAGMTGLKAINTVPDGSIPDVPMTHPQAAAIYKLYRAGILQGNDEWHSCLPDSNIRRSEVAAILTRMMDAGERISFTMKEETPGDALTITAQPSDVTVTAGEKAAFSVTVSGGRGPYSYQWKKVIFQDNSFSITDDAEKYSGTKTATLTVEAPAVRVSESGTQYCCYISDASGAEVISDAATLFVTAAVAPLTITAQPSDVTVTEGEAVTFSVTVSGGEAPYTYQWSEITPQDSEFGLADGTENYSGTKTAALTVEAPAVRVSESGTRYRCYVYDAKGTEVISDTAILTVKAASDFKITAQPQDVTIGVGGDATFTVTVEGGKAPYTYEWHYSDFSGDAVATDGEWFSGAGTDTLISRSCGVVEDGDQYYCVITDADGNKVTSDRATLTVH